MTAFYNDNDPFAAAWLRLLIEGGHIVHGVVDERSVNDLDPKALDQHAQVHLFAGIGGWSYALRLAGVPDDFPIWSGSCPCQPFSAAGRAGGVLDSRHLWPAFRRLVAECRPPIIVGEQVASGAGRAWLAGVRLDLEGLGYAVGAADLCAAGVGAPHIRQRLYWVAGHGEASGARSEMGLRAGADARDRGEADGLGDAHIPGSQGRRLPEGERTGELSPWATGVLIPCADGKQRRIEPGIQPLAYGVPNRVGTLRGAGNAIVPQVAAAFLRAALKAALALHGE